MNRVPRMTRCAYCPSEREGRWGERMPLKGLETAHLKLHGHWNKYILSWMTADHTASETPLSVMMPLAPKDIIRARRSIKMIRKNLAHPIEKFVIVAPDDPDIRALCDAENVAFIDERAPLSPLLGKERLDRLEGWYRQQFLKLTATDVVGTPKVLAIDSDTYPVRPTTFLTPDGRSVFYMATRDRSPFEQFTKHMVGSARRMTTSFVAHCMLFEAEHLASLHRAIEAHCQRQWVDAILSHIARPMADVGLMSEFDLYGQHLLQSDPTHLAKRPFSNLKVSIEQFLGDPELAWWNRRFRFLSSHQHLS